MSKLPLEGVRVLEPANLVAAPFISRNKKSVTLDLRHPRGQELFQRLVEKADVVIENFRPGTMEGWGLGWEELRRVNPRLIFARGSGFGQTGPYSSLPSFGNNVEAYSTLTNSLGYADTPPVTSGLGDHMADVLADPHFQARRVVTEVNDPELGPLKMVDVVPRLSETPGRVKHIGPGLGEHNEEIYGRLLGMRSGEIQALKREGAI